MVDSSFPFLALDNILLSGCITVYVAICFMKDILATSKFGQFWKKKSDRNIHMQLLVWTYIFNSFEKMPSPRLAGSYSGVGVC